MVHVYSQEEALYAISYLHIGPWKIWFNLKGLISKHMFQITFMSSSCEISHVNATQYL